MAVPSLSLKLYSYTNGLSNLQTASVGVIGTDTHASVTKTLGSSDTNLYVHIGGCSQRSEAPLPLPAVDGTLYIWNLAVTCEGETVNYFDIDGDAYAPTTADGYEISGWSRDHLLAGAGYGKKLASYGDFFSVPRRIVGTHDVVTAPTSCKFLLMADTHIDSDFQNDTGIPWYTMWKPHYEALTDTYQFVNEHFPDLDFALFCGDSTNTGYEDHPEKMAKELVNYRQAIAGLDIYKKSAGKDLSCFRLERPDHEESLRYGPSELQNAVIAIQGNHDPGVKNFYRDCAFTGNKVKFVCFFARYHATGPATGSYPSTGLISDESLAFVEREFKKAEDEAVEYLVLVCHWSIVNNDPHFGWSILNACPENGYNDNRRWILELSEQYGCDLYISGHEHNNSFPIGVAGPLKNISLGTATKTWGIAEITDDLFTLEIYSTATANPVTGEITAHPHKIKTVSMPLTKRRILVAQAAARKEHASI